MPVAEDTLSISDVIVQLQDYSPTVRIYRYLNNYCDNVVSDVSMTVLSINLIYIYRYPILLQHLYAQKLDLRQMTLECKFISVKGIFCINPITLTLFLYML